MKKRTAKDLKDKYSVGTFDGVNCVGVAMIRSLYGIKEDRDSASVKLELCGLPDELFIEKREAASFLDALQHFEDEGFIRKTENCFEHITYQCVAEALDQATGGMSRLRFSDKAIVRFYKPGRGEKGGTVESDTPGVADTILAMMETEKETVRTPEIAAYINRLLSRNGEAIGLCRTGGAVFLPYSKEQIELAENIQKFIALLSGINSCFILPIAANKEENKRSVFESLNDDIGRVLRDIDRDTKTIGDLLADPEARKPSAKIKSCYERIKESKSRVEAYCDLLGYTKDSILQKIEQKSAALTAVVAL